MEYLLVHGGGRGHHLHYELLYDGQSDGRHLCGLIDATELDKVHDYDARKLGQSAGKLASSLGQVAPGLGPSWSGSSHVGTGMEANRRDIAQNRPIHANSIDPVVVAG